MDQTSGIKAEIMACEQRLYAAQLASDVAVLQDLIADELIFVGPAGDLFTKQMDLDMHRSGGINITQLDPQEQEIRCLDGVAIAVVKAFLAGTFQGAPFSGDFRYTRVWQQTGSGWRIVAGHCSAIA